MRNVFDEIFSSLNDLCSVYEMYIWNRNNCKLDVLIQDNSIAMYLYDNGEVIDEFVINYLSVKREIKLYRYMSIRLLLRLLGNVIMYSDNNIIFNDKQKSGIRFIVNDEGILEIIDKIIDEQHHVLVNDKMNVIINMYNRLNFRLSLYKFSDELYNRVNISKKMLRSKKV